MLLRGFTEFDIWTESRPVGGADTIDEAVLEFNAQSFPLCLNRALN